jgi:hypothetical protein
MRWSCADGALAWVVSNGSTLMVCGHTCRQKHTEGRTVDSATRLSRVRFGPDHQLLWLRNGHQRDAQVR